jgi:hypothetical protein
MSSRVWPPIGTPPGLGCGVGLEEEAVEPGIGRAAGHLRISGTSTWNQTFLSGTLSGANWR